MGDRLAKRGRKKKQDPEKLGRAKKGRAEYVIACIHDQPWLDGEWSKLIKLVCDRFACSESAASPSVSLAYQLLDEERNRRVQYTVGYLDRVHRKTIEIGFRNQDGRVITPAAAELRKLHGVGAPDNVKVTGDMTHSHQVSPDDVLLLQALKLTNAQRQARIDEIDRQLGVPLQQGQGQAGAPSAVVSKTETATTTATEDDHGQESDDFDDEQ
jgi:hypothetical protein